MDNTVLTPALFQGHNHGANSFFCSLVKNAAYVPCTAYFCDRSNSVALLANGGKKGEKPLRQRQLNENCFRSSVACHTTDSAGVSPASRWMCINSPPPPFPGLLTPLEKIIK